MICLGGGAGNESVYADEVPKGKVVILLDVPVIMFAMVESELLYPVGLVVVG